MTPAGFFSERLATPPLLQGSSGTIAPHVGGTAYKSVNKRALAFETATNYDTHKISVTVTEPGTIWQIINLIVEAIEDNMKVTKFEYTVHISKKNPKHQLSKKKH